MAGDALTTCGILVGCLTNSRVIVSEGTGKSFRMPQISRLLRRVTFHFGLHQPLWDKDHVWRFQQKKNLGIFKSLIGTYISGRLEVGLSGNHIDGLESWQNSSMFSQGRASMKHFCCFVFAFGETGEFGNLVGIGSFLFCSLLNASELMVWNLLLQQHCWLGDYFLEGLPTSCCSLHKSTVYWHFFLVVPSILSRSW